MSTDVLDFAMNFEDAQQAEADKKLLVAFYKGLEKNEFKSIEAGRPIFDEMDLIKIITPGSRDSFVGLATEEYCWFEGYTWQYASCSDCGEHLGWFYQSGENSQFYGLIVDKLVRYQA